MLVNFNLEKLDRLLLDFYTLTGLTISVWDSDLNQLSFQPKQMPDFCRFIKKTPEGRRRCFQCDKALCEKCAETDQIATHYCHAGLIDTAIPIKFHDTVLGYMMFGQVTDKSPEEASAAVCRLAREIGLEEDALLSAYTTLDKYNPDILPSAANVLKAATRYLWLSRYIEIVNNDLAGEIDSYIRKHFRSPLSVSGICSVFGISKNKLYSISHKFFKETVNDYINRVRINEAIHLLISTDLSVQQISAAVGMEDYNYFTKVFKKKTGITPLKYRKGYPFA